MARFISRNPDLVLYGIDGSVKKTFVNGVYNGTITDAECYDSTNKVWKIMPKVSITDLSGKTVGDSGVVAAEICGLGSLNGKSNTTITNGLPAGAALDSDADTALALGLSKGIFFYSPLLAVDGTDGYTLTIKGYYTVDSSSTNGVVYRGITYGVGETFRVSDISSTSSLNVVSSAVSGTDVSIFLDTPPLDRANQFYDEAFKLAHLEQGDEFGDYYTFGEYGFTPHTDAGWTR